jgi:hypothetical protein
MADWLAIVIVLGVWMALQTWLFPKLGVPT